MGVLNNRGGNMSIKLGASTFVVIMLTVLILVVQLSTMVTGVLDVTLLYRTCGDSGNSLGPYADAVRRIRELMRSRTHVSNYNYRTEIHRNGVDCHWRSWCRWTLSLQECIDCLRVADYQIIVMCANPLKALLGLVDCGMRIDFLPIYDE